MAENLNNVEGMWIEVLARMGVTVETVDADHAHLRSDAASVTLRLHRINRQIAPSQVPTPPPEPSLLAVTRATDRAVTTAVNRGWDIVTDDGKVHVQIGDRLVSHQRIAPAWPGEGRRGPISWATFTLGRRLLAGPAATQERLAERTGTSQATVSRALGRWARAGLVEQTSAGWQPTSFDALADWWIANYPGPGGVTSYWYSLDAPRTQVRAVLDVLDRPVAVSGDPAADALAPWRRPSTVTIYAQTGQSLASAGFVPVGSPDEATLTLCAPRDPGIWLPAPWVASGMPICDPVQILYDLAVSRGSDRVEAGNHLRTALCSTLSARWRAAVTESST